MKIHRTPALLSRRQIIATSLAASLVAPLSSFASTNKNNLLISASTDKQGKHWACCFNDKGEPVSQLALPDRAHQITKHPHKSEMAIVGRRPGRYLLISAILSGKVIWHIEPEPGFHFYGHAVYSADGRFLITTENHIATGQGYIFVRESSHNYRVISHFPSNGIGPHEVRLCSDQDTLVIANGGILTHPEKGRAKLNLDTMSPSLSYTSLKTGKVLEQIKLSEDHHQLSIRHIDINDRDEVLIGMQYQGDRTDHVPLVASHKKGEALQLLWAPEQENYAMKQYCGSVCFDPSGNTAAISSPKGDLITFWDYTEKKFLSSVRIKDGCGLASFRNNEFIISNGFGQLFHFHTLDHLLYQLNPTLDTKFAWDNHLSIA